jgi:hypothetical protein
MRQRPADAAGVTLAWLGHPVTVAALVVLVVNDHVLKAAYVFGGPLVTSRWLLQASGLASLTTLAVAAPFVLWASGVLASFTVAAVLAAFAGGAGLWMSVLTGLRSGLVRSPRVTA